MLKSAQLCAQSTHIVTPRNHHETTYETTRFLSHFPRNRWILKILFIYLRNIFLIEWWFRAFVDKIRVVSWLVSYWFRVVSCISVFAQLDGKNRHGEIPRCCLLHGLRTAILHVFVSKLFTNSIWGAMKLNPFWVVWGTVWSASLRVHTNMIIALEVAIRRMGGWG